jgi:hypothetical protein
MKKLLLILLICISQTAFSQTPTQNLEVLMIGASHSYDPKIPQDLTAIHAKIRAFKPDAIFGEWLSPEDEKAIKNYWNKEGVMKRYERLKSRKTIPESELSSEIARYEAIIDKNPKDMKARVDLAVAHYLSFDAGNGYFQMWHVAKHLQKNPKDTAVFKYAQKMFFTSAIDSVHKAILPYIDDEYDYIAHPMMVELGIKKMYAMDSQRWDDQWSTAWGNADSVFYAQRDKYLADSLSEKGKKVKELKAIVKNRMAFLEADAAKVYGENHATEALNGPQMAEWLFKINFFAEEYRELDFFPADLYGWMTHYWWHRNNDMCNNTISRSKANGFNKVVIVVGANHAAAMTKNFKEKGIKVININDATMK